MKKTLLLIAILVSSFTSAQTITLGTGTSSSATRGPLQRSDSNSSSVYSRAALHYTADELSGDLTSSATISQINFDLGSTNVITASGDAVIVIYMKNSTTTEVVGDSSWNDAIAGATEVGTYTFNTTNNFPGAEGFLSFPLDTSFSYSGGALEVYVDWDCSNLVAADSSQPNLLFSGNGSLNWHWTSTTPLSTNYRAGSSGAPSTLQASRAKSERVNTQLVYSPSTASVDDVFASKVSVYPNPANEFVTISSAVEINKVEVYNLLGKKVISTSKLNNNNLDVSTLAKGVYMMKLTSGEFVASKKLIKN